MDKKNTNINMWLILLVDIISVVFAFSLSAFIRGGIIRNRTIPVNYDNLLVVIILSTIIIDIITNNVNFFKRGFRVELRYVITTSVKLCIVMFCYMFAVKEESNYSLIFFILFFLIEFLTTYVTRCYLKLILLIIYRKSSFSNKVMLVTTSEEAERIINRILEEYKWNMQVNMVAILDKNKIGEKILGVDVVADAHNLIDTAKLSVVDEVFIYLPDNSHIKLDQIIMELEQMGIAVHINLTIFENLKIKEKVIDKFARYSVVTFSSGFFNEQKVLVKRLIDILGGIVGCILTGILTIFLGPAILIESPGPIFFSQIRIGKNGRKFKLYKFRSMYKDADEHKVELMEQNEMNGLMFKITNDPRITKIGRFIRKTSLDEFPQFLNVLKGDMSLVGTRPPTEDEFKQYEARHKRRLSLKPGLTGLWQVSGRSDIEDFDDVVKLDLEYIDNWSVKYDIWLIIKTVFIVIMKKGSK